MDNFDLEKQLRELANKIETEVAPVTAELLRTGRSLEASQILFPAAEMVESLRRSAEQ